MKAQTITYTEDTRKDYALSVEVAADAWGNITVTAIIRKVGHWRAQGYSIRYNEVDATRYPDMLLVIREALDESAAVVGKTNLQGFAVRRDGLAMRAADEVMAAIMEAVEADALPVAYLNGSVQTALAYLVNQKWFV